MDGTLLDSMRVWESVAEDYLISQGKTPMPGLYSALLALGGHEIPRYFQRVYGIRETEDEILSGIYRLLEEFYFYKAPLKDGAIPVLEALLDSGVKMCVATATDRRLVEPALRRCGVLEYFDRIFTCREEETSKNRPDIYIRAAAFMGTEVNETLVAEDAPYAIRTAKMAGFTVAAIYDLSADAQKDELRKESDFYFDSLRGMLKIIRD